MYDTKCISVLVLGPPALPYLYAASAPSAPTAVVPITIVEARQVLCHLRAVVDLCHYCMYETFRDADDLCRRSSVDTQKYATSIYSFFIAPSAWSVYA